MKTVLLEIEDSKFEQFMGMINLLKSDVVKKFEIKKENNSLSLEHELLEDLTLFKSGQLETTEITDIETLNLTNNPLAKELQKRIKEIDDGTMPLTPFQEGMDEMMKRIKDKYASA